MGLEGSCLQSRWVGSKTCSVLTESVFFFPICDFFHVSLTASYPTHPEREVGIAPFSLIETWHISRPFYCFWVIDSECIQMHQLRPHSCWVWQQGNLRGCVVLTAKVTLIIILVRPAELNCLGRSGGVRQIQSLALLSLVLSHAVQPAVEKEQNGQRNQFIFSVVNPSGSIWLFLKVWSWKVLWKCAIHWRVERVLLYQDASTCFWLQHIPVCRVTLWTTICRIWAEEIVRKKTSLRESFKDQERGRHYLFACYLNSMSNPDLRSDGNY